jgi:AbrB family looped-hinge helix DNA binding protein
MRDVVMRMDAKGRVVLPASTREAMRLGPGALLDFKVSGDQVVIRPVVVVPRRGVSVEGEGASDGI